MDASLFVRPGGVIHFVYTDDLDFRGLGSTSVHRASTVEPDGDCLWWANLRKSGGGLLGPFPTRGLALAAEISWLEKHLGTETGVPCG